MEDLSLEEKMMIKFTSFFQIGETVFTFEDSRENRLRAVDFEKGLEVGDSVGNSSGKCQVCFSDECSVILIPCMHGGICSYCANELIKKHRSDQAAN